MGPDGNLYILTSNQDGRGTPAENDDRILKIIPIVSKEKIIGDSSLPPLKQLSIGIDPHNVICKEGLELIFKKSNFNPACVKPSSIEKLIEREWAAEHNPDHDGQFHRLEHQK